MMGQSWHRKGPVIPFQFRVVAPEKTQLHRKACLDCCLPHHPGVQASAAYIHELRCLHPSTEQQHTRKRIKPSRLTSMGAVPSCLTPVSCSAASMDTGEILDHGSSGHVPSTNKKLCLVVQVNVILFLHEELQKLRWSFHLAMNWPFLLAYPYCWLICHQKIL